MKVFSHELTSSLEDLPSIDFPCEKIDLVFIHGSPFSLEDPILLDNFRDAFPNAELLGCSSAGEMINGQTFDNAIVFSALHFEKSTIKSARVGSSENESDEFDGGRKLAASLDADDLQFIVIYCEGLGLDCDEMISGIQAELGRNIPIAGGLAGDSLLFERTILMDRDGAYDNGAVAVGIYGDSFTVNRSASLFEKEGIGIEISASDGNMLTGINGRPALEEYTKMLGEKADQLPGICLNFPITILDPETQQPLYCRTMHEIIDNNILAAGTVPEGPARLIDLTNPEDFFIDANNTSKAATTEAAEFAVIVNCAGRRAALGDRWTEEQSIIQDNFAEIPSIGFYSYGEIGECRNTGSTIVHNQAVNIFTFHET